MERSKEWLEGYEASKNGRAKEFNPYLNEKIWPYRDDREYMREKELKASDWTAGWEAHYYKEA